MSWLTGRRFGLFGGVKGSTADNPPSAEQPDGGSIPPASTNTLLDFWTNPEQQAVREILYGPDPFSITPRALTSEEIEALDAYDKAQPASTIPNVWAPSIVSRDMLFTLALLNPEDHPDHEPYCYECGRPYDADR